MTLTTKLEDELRMIMRAESSVIANDTIGILVTALFREDSVCVVVVDSERLQNYTAMQILRFNFGQIMSYLEKVGLRLEVVSGSREMRFKNGSRILFVQWREGGDNLRGLTIDAALIV